LIATLPGADIGDTRLQDRKLRIKMTIINDVAAGRAIFHRYPDSGGNGMIINLPSMGSREKIDMPRRSRR